MTLVLLRLSDTQNNKNDRPQKCPHCGSEILHGWGVDSKTVMDTEPSVACVHRYRCNECNRTFRVYPAGVDRSNISLRVRRLAAIAWALGMSSRDVVEYFSQFDISLSHTTVWRDGQELIAQQCGREGENSAKRFYLDKHFIPHVSSRLGVVIAMDMGSGRVSVLGTLDEYNPRRVISWLRNLVEGVADLVTTETKILYQAFDQASKVTNTDNLARCGLPSPIMK